MHRAWYKDFGRGHRARPLWGVLGLVLLLTPLRAWAGDTALQAASFAQMQDRMGGIARLNALPPRPEPGHVFSHPVWIDGLWLGAGFHGIAQQDRHSAGGVFDDAAPPHVASAPLRLRTDPPGQGLALAYHRGFGSVAAFPLGPMGAAMAAGRGEGALAVLFVDDSPGLGLRVHSDYPDPLGARTQPPGQLRILAFDRGGALLGQATRDLQTGVNEIAFERPAGQADIAGFLVLNTDPGGIAIDDILRPQPPRIGRLDPAPPNAQDGGQLWQIFKGTKMPKAYWVAHVDVEDPQIYEDYKRLNAAPFAEYGARFLVRGGQQTVREGAARGRTVVIEFPSYAAALACFDSPGYQQAKAVRDPISMADMVIVEGYDG